MRLIRRALLAAVVCCVVLPLPASAATTIDTTGSWDGLASVWPWGYSNTATYGQTVTVPATDTKLDSFSFWMQHAFGGTEFRYKAYVYAWDGQKATGAPVWQSPAMQTVVLPSGGGYQEVKTETGGINLAAGQNYVLFLSISEAYGSYTQGTVARWQWVMTNPYAGGGTVWDNNGGDTSAWTSSIWDNPACCGFDMAFKAVFGSANATPTVETAASDANGSEGDTLSSSGAFADGDGDPLTLTADNTEGTFTDNGDGTWSWSLGTSDDVAGGTITVTADDGNGGTVTDSFDYSAANVAPSVGTAASDAGGLVGDTLTASGAFSDVSGDPLTLTADNTVGTFTDNGDGTWSWSYPSAAMGAGTITVTANDGDSGTNTDEFAYDVDFDWAGFFSPVNNKNADGDYVLNKANPGRAIPVKFSLAGYHGMDVIESDYPRSQSIACEVSSTTVDGIEQTVTADGSSLSYNYDSGQYEYVWKTSKAWANSCRQLVIELVDGTTYRANFKFTK